MFWIKKEKTTQAKLISRKENQTVDVSFSRANPETFWHANLSDLSNHVFSVREEGARFALCLGHPGEAEKILASFDERFEAEEAKETIQKLLAGENRSARFYLLRFFSAVLFFVMAYYLIGAASTGPADKTPLNNQEQKIQSEKPGVPLNADDVLTPPNED